MKHKLEVNSDISRIKEINSWLEKSLYKNITNEKTKNNINLVLQETFVNAVIHGNNKNIKKKVLISYEIINNILYLKIKDEGKGIKKIHQNKNFIENKDILKESGKGLILIKHFCKNVIFNNNIIELEMEL